MYLKSCCSLNKQFSIGSFLAWDGHHWVLTNLITSSYSFARAYSTITPILLFKETKTNMGIAVALWLWQLSENWDTGVGKPIWAFT